MAMAARIQDSAGFGRGPARGGNSDLFNSLPSLKQLTPRFIATTVAILAFSCTGRPMHCETVLTAINHWRRREQWHRLHANSGATKPFPFRVHG